MRRLSLYALAATALTLPAFSQAFNVGGPGGLIPAVGTGGGGNSQTLLPTASGVFAATAAVPAGGGAISNVTLTGLTHTWSGDLQIVLVNPNGLGYNLVVRLGVVAPAACCGFAADFAGDYEIVPAASALINQVWPQTNPAAPHPAGIYPQEFGTMWGAGWTSGAANVSNIDLASIPVIPGIWTLAIYDGAAGDTGTLASWSMSSGGGAPSLGTSYCGPAVQNTSLASAVITATGSASAAANNLTLVAGSLPANQFGFFLTSMTQGFIPMPGGISVGNLCLGGTVGRYVGPGQIMNAGAGGTFSLALDLTQTPAGPVFAVITAGQTWNFQAWFRDNLPTGAPTSNFTDGRSILFN